MVSLLGLRKKKQLDQSGVDVASAGEQIDEPLKKRRFPFMSGRGGEVAVRDRRGVKDYGVLAGMRPMDSIGDRVIDSSGNKLVVWEVQGNDINDGTVEVSWERTINSVDHPIQVLVRQHLPRLDLVRSNLRASRPEAMREGLIGEVADSLLDYLAHIEANDRIVDRRRYVVCRELDLLKASSLMVGSGLMHRELKGDDLKDLYASCYSGLSPHPMLREEMDEFQALEYAKHLELRGRFVRCFELVDYPRVVGPQYLESLLDYGVEMDLSLYIWPVDQNEAQSRLRTQMVRWQGQRGDLIQRGRVVPPEVDMVVEDVERLWGDVQRGVSQLFRVSITIAVYGRSVEELAESSQVVTSYFRSSMSRIQPMTFRHGVGFRSVMPTMRAGSQEPYLTDTGTLKRFYPFTPPDMNTRGGTLFGMDRRSRSPIIFDPFDASRMNGHMIMMARSGAGKSYTTKLRVVREATRGIPVYLIDPDGEYGPIAKMMGGRVLVPGRPGYGMNPFATVYVDVGYLTDKCTNICYLMRVMLQGEVDQAGVSVIDRCVSGFYSDQLRRIGQAGMVPQGELLAAGGMREFYSYLRSDDAPDDAMWLANMMERFAVGSVRFLMASSDEGVSDDLMMDERPVTTFNLRSLSDQLKPVAVSVCAEVVWGLAVSKPRPRIMVVDECWTVLSTPEGSAVLLAIAKRARKYKLALMAVTQDVQDFLATIEGKGVTGHAGLSLLQNACDKFVLAQDDNVYEEVCKVLNLTSTSREFLRTVGRGQGLLVSAGSGQFPVEMISTVKEHELLLDPSWLEDGQSIDADLEARLLREYVDGKDIMDLGADQYKIGLTSSDLLAEELEARIQGERRSDEIDFA